MGIHVDGNYFVDKCFPMGCSISCMLFESFSRFIEWVVVTRSGMSSINHFLDDFIFMVSEVTNECSKMMGVFSEVCEELGVPIAENKTLGPTTVLSFLGFVIDTKLKMILIPPEKTEKLKLILHQLLKKKKATLKEPQSATGLMSFCSKAIPSARAFIRHLFDLMEPLTKPYHKIRLNLEVKADISLWLEFLDNFNGQCFSQKKTGFQMKL